LKLSSTPGTEYGASAAGSPSTSTKLAVESDDPQALDQFKRRKYQFMAFDKDGRDVFLAESDYVLRMPQQTSKTAAPLQFGVLTPLI
jgi:peptide chain release factor 3